MREREVYRDDQGKRWVDTLNDDGSIYSQHEHWTLTEKVERLRPHFRVCYARIGEWTSIPPYSLHPEYRWNGYELRPEHISYSDVSDTPGGHDGSFVRAFVDLGDVARGDDQAGQSSTLDRSNFRKLREDFPGVFTYIGYSNTDTLGAYVGNLTEDVVEILAGLKTDHPAYDESDMSALEWEEMQDSWGEDERSDLRNEICRGADRELSDLWEALEDVELPCGDSMKEAWEVIFWKVNDDNGGNDYWEHDGYSVNWDHKRLIPALSEAVCSYFSAMPVNPSQAMLAV